MLHTFDAVLFPSVLPIKSDFCGHVCDLDVDQIASAHIFLSYK